MATYFLGSDDAGYLGIAINLLKTGEFANPDWSFPVYPPLYPLFAALVYSLFGMVIDLPSQLNFVIFTSVLVLPVFWLAREFYGRKEAIVSGLSIALFPSLLLSQQVNWTSAEHIEIICVWSGIFCTWKGIANSKTCRFSSSIYLCDGHYRPADHHRLVAPVPGGAR